MTARLMSYEEERMTTKECNQKALSMFLNSIGELVTPEEFMHIEDISWSGLWQVFQYSYYEQEPWMLGCSSWLSKEEELLCLEKAVDIKQGIAPGPVPAPGLESTPKRELIKMLCSDIHDTRYNIWFFETHREDLISWLGSNSEQLSEYKRTKIKHRIKDYGFSIASEKADLTELMKRLKLLMNIKEEKQ